MQNLVAVISLKNIVNNAARVSELTRGTPLIAVVKDDAYGHGAERVALALQNSVSAFAVATVEEGVRLRTACVDKDVLVLTPPLSEEEALRSVAYGLTVTVGSFSSLYLTARAAEKFGLSVRLHLAVNTGMNRYGFRPALVDRACRECLAAGLSAEGVFSHLYAPHDEVSRGEQLALFREASAVVREYFPEAVRHLAATGGILSGGEYFFDAVRAGISLYGYLPNGFSGDYGLKPAMRVYAPVAQSGRTVGSGAGYARARLKSGYFQTVRLGYGDGFFREGIAGGVGKLCMDAHVREGRNNFGRRRLAIKDISAYAAEHGTTEYEILCNIARKAVKIYE